MTVKTLQDAIRVDAIRALLDAQPFDTREYRPLRQFFENSVEIGEALTQYERIYAIRVGRETGIWAGMSWYVNYFLLQPYALTSVVESCRDKIENLTNFKNSKYKGHRTFRDALLYMIEKAPYNWDSKASPKKQVSFSSSLHAFTAFAIIHMIRM